MIPSHADRNHNIIITSTVYTPIRRLLVVVIRYQSSLCVGGGMGGGRESDWLVAGYADLDRTPILVPINAFAKSSSSFHFLLHPSTQTIITDT